MKGVLLAGGTGSRLLPLTRVTNKHLLPIYDRPMIYYPILKMREMGVDNLLIVTGKGHAGHFLELLGSGSEFGINISYEVQENAGGIAQALGLAENFIKDEKFIVMLGDNIFEDVLIQDFKDFTASNEMKAHIFLKTVNTPQSYGVARFEAGKLIEIIEKPKDPPSDKAVTGCYFYTPDIFKIISQLKPSLRGELEISHVNDIYVKAGAMSYTLLGGYWGDCGESIDKNLDVSLFIQANPNKFP